MKKIWIFIQHDLAIIKDDNENFVVITNLSKKFNQPFLDIDNKILELEKI